MSVTQLPNSKQLLVEKENDESEERRKQKGSKEGKRRKNGCPNPAKNDNRY